MNKAEQIKQVELRLGRVYSADNCIFHKEDPEQLAFDECSNEGYDSITIYQADAYKPNKGGDEEDLMIGEGWAYLVKNQKEYKSYSLDAANDWVMELPTASDLKCEWPSCGISGLRGRS